MAATSGKGFLRFIGVSEVLGAMGLVFPWLLNIRPRLTPLAAAGLLIIMIGAIVTSAVYADTATALIPLLVAVLLAFVVYGRWRPPHPRTKP